MKQRTVFASALLHSPRVLVVDEPMVGLDPHSIRLVKDLLQREVAAGMCVLMSTHTLTAAEEIANRVGIMSHGRLLFDGTVGKLRERFPAANLIAGGDVPGAYRADSQRHTRSTEVASSDGEARHNFAAMNEMRTYTRPFDGHCRLGTGKCRAAAQRGPRGAVAVAVAISRRADAICGSF